MIRYNIFLYNYDRNVDVGIVHLINYIPHDIKYMYDVHGHRYKCANFTVDELEDLW